MANDAVKIEDGIPVPPRSKYPLDRLKVGQSFEVKGDPDVLTRTVQSKASILRQKRPRIKFTTRTVEGGLRVWRVR